MLKRRQVLMNDWLIEYWQEVAGILDLSFSEVLRLALCKHVIDVTEMTYCKYKPKFNKKIIKKIFSKRHSVETIPQEKLCRFISKFYFEAQKATELWIEEG